MRFQKVHMQRRKVTVHFGSVRVVVPCPSDEMTVGQLAEASVQRYKKATGKVDTDVRVLHLECLRDGGILDPDDRVSDVFDESRDQILSIFDEQSQSGSGLPSYQLISPIPTSSSFNSNNSNVGGPLTSSPLPRSTPSRHPRPSSVFTESVSSPPYPPSSGLNSSSSMDFPQQNNDYRNNNGNHYAHPVVPASYGRSPVVGRNSVVEVKNFDNAISNGIRVLTLESTPSGSPPIRSSLRSEASTPSRQHRVTLSPEVEKKLTDAERGSSGRFARSSARKSRISETFYEAQERLEEARNAHQMSATTPSVSHRVPLQEESPNETIITFPDDNRSSMGLEVSGVYEQPSSANNTPSRQYEMTAPMRSPGPQLMSVEIVQIDPEGRVGRDGRLKAGDKIVAIDGRPVSQMSILRARAYIGDLQEKAAPTLTVARPISSFAEDPNGISDRNTSATSSQRKPVQSALQQANTRAIGQTITVNLTKSHAGFGFTVTGRETAQGERLFYIGTVKPNGVALGHLRAGDRLLEINGEGTSEMTQSEVVERLKQARVGDTVSFLVSRVTASDEEGKENREELPQEKREEMREKPPVFPQDVPPREHTISPRGHEFEEHEFVIPLNSTGSAGLGIRLKARVTIRSDKSRQDCGIFVKALLHGGAADKDGRLRVDDRIVGIEGIRLDKDSNDVGSKKISGCFKALGSSTDSVRISVQRKTGIFAETSLLLDHHHETMHSVTATPSPISLRFSQSSDDKRSSITSDITRADDLEASSGDAFDREAPTRKSMSEKRGMGSSHDPNHIKLFQDIKHQRQTSAPPMSSASPMTSSFHGQSTRSASQRAAARARSQSVHPRSPAQSASQHPSPAHLAPSNASDLRRRSQSMESINTQRNSQSGRDYDGSGPHPYPPGADIYVQRREPSTSSRDRQRRKSVGSAVKSWFGFSKDSSPERNERIRQEAAARLEEEDRRRVQEHYDRLRQKEAAANRNISSASMPGRGYPAPYTTTDYTPPQLPSPEQPLILANSRFYASQRASAPRTTTTTSSIATRPIATPTSTERPPGATRRPITTLFPVDNNQPTTSSSPTTSSNGTPLLHTTSNNNSIRTSVRCRDAPPPTTTTCSTRGSRTAVEAPWEQLQSSRLPTGHRDDQRTEGSGEPPRVQLRTSFRKQQSLPNSTPIAFPTTRFAFTPPSHFSNSSTGSAERLSMRARKQRRREVQSVIVSSPHPPTPVSNGNRTVTPITGPAPDYCTVWNHWNTRTGSSLPARRPRPPRPRLNQTLYEAVTDC